MTEINGRYRLNYGINYPVEALKPGIIVYEGEKEELGNTCISDVTYDELTTDGKLDRRRKDEEYTPNRHFMSHVSFIYDMNDYSLLVEDWIDKYLNIYSLN